MVHATVCIIEGASIASYDEYETLLGNISIDKKYSNDLKEKYTFLSFEDKYILEHSTETQAPFIKHYFPMLQIVVIVYGKMPYEELSLLIDEVLDDEETISYFQLI